MLWWIDSEIESALARRSLKHPRRDHFKVSKGLGLIASVTVKESRKHWFVRHKFFDKFILGPFENRETAEFAADNAFQELLRYSKQDH